MDYFEQFVAFVSTQPPEVIYLVLFLAAFLENLLPPIPGDSVIVFGAYLAGLGVLSEGDAFFWMWIGSYSGCMAVYGIAYRKGRAFFTARSPKTFSDARFAKAELWFARYGGKLIVFNRFIPAVRCVIGICAGIGRVKPMPMALYVGLGTFVWNGLLVYAGLLVGANWKLILRILKAYNWAMLLLLALGLCVGAVIWYRRFSLGLEKDFQDSKSGLP